MLLGVKAVFRTVGERWRIWIPGLPLSALVWAGWKGATVWMYVDLTALFLFLLLICDPFALSSKVLAPAGRGGLITGGGLLLAAMQLPGMELYFRCWIGLIGVVILIVVVLKNRSWLLRWEVRQSPQVDRAIAQLAHGGDCAANEAWERYGCREVRAVIHQACHMVCSETLISNPCKAAYLVAYLHGQVESERQIQRLKKQMERLRQTAEMNLSIFDDLAEKNREIEDLRGQLQDARAESEVLRSRYHRLQQEADRALAGIGTALSEPKNRDADILAYVEAGHSYTEAGAAFDLSKTRIYEIVKKQREKQQEVAS